MPTECSAEQFDFGIVEGRAVEAAFDAGLVTSDAGALLLGATDRAIGMMGRFAACFHDERQAHLIEHEVVTLVGQRVFGIALGYEDLNDHDELRHDPLMAVLAGKLTARREDCAPVAGKSTLNRLELSRLAPTRSHKISHNPVAIKNLFVDLFVEAHARAPQQIILDLDATDDPVHGEQEGRCCARCAASGCAAPSWRKPPAAPSGSSCSRSGRSCASAFAASGSPWPRPVRPHKPGALRPSGSRLPRWPAPRRPDTRRRTRHSRGITSGPSRSFVAAPAAQEKSQTGSRYSGATTTHVPEKFDQPSRNTALLCEDSVRNSG